MSVKETFHEIEEGDVVRFDYMASSHDYTVDSIYGEGEDKEIFFGLGLERLILVIINGKVNYEKRARGHPWDWTVNDVIHNLKIVEKSD